jgi:hypothetical protein
LRRASHPLEPLAFEPAAERGKLEHRPRGDGEERGGDDGEFEEFFD